MQNLASGNCVRNFLNVSWRKISFRQKRNVSGMKRTYRELTNSDVPENSRNSFPLFSTITSFILFLSMVSLLVMNSFSLLLLIFPNLCCSMLWAASAAAQSTCTVLTLNIVLSSFINMFASSLSCSLEFVYRIPCIVTSDQMYISNSTFTTPFGRLTIVDLLVFCALACWMNQNVVSSKMKRRKTRN